jgi:hypothetical protein
MARGAVGVVSFMGKSAAPAREQAKIKRR